MSTELQRNKEKVLIACRRCCAICLQQKGTGIEVHHIIPKAKGGSDDFDNLIPLCFDCHQDVGGYNPDHPKGNKYTPAELKAHRDALYRRVQEGILPNHSNGTTTHILIQDSNQLYQRQLLIERDFKPICTYIYENDLRKVPTEFMSESDRLLLEYKFDSFFAHSSLLVILDEITEILAFKEHPSYPPLDPDDPVVECLSELRKKFINEYQRVFYPNFEDV